MLTLNGAAVQINIKKVMGCCIARLQTVTDSGTSSFSNVGKSLSSIDCYALMMCGVEVWAPPVRCTVVDEIMTQLAFYTE
jgi:hypothetical protein